MSRILKAVIPAAGLGTRFSPITNAIPKELLPVVDRASIQYVVDEACEAGIEEIIIVISEAKESIRQYFDRLTSTTSASIKYVYQHEQLGLGHAILCCSEAIGQESFAVLLPDDIIHDEKGALTQLLEIYSRVGSSVIAVQRVLPEFISSYGIIEPTVADDVIKVIGLIEKPEIDKAPSDFGIVGRYILSPMVLEILSTINTGALGEIQLTDALAQLVSSQDLYAVHIQGERFDVGNPTGLLKASIVLALRRQDTATDFKGFLGSIL
ncbi:MAG: UTP--glucose-1-phosphate uridylyltransferase [SAR202 cluster bacterium]|nr:UTP--glucose-1-phosphate uridylyltransferase [SAR202 cluster bacterium]|tara:strand:- start:129 stop:929 length:801 start_codon:yes stop_codon:yes gene_type:complete